MRRDTLKALYEVHSWIGLFLGLVLYVVLFSGSVSLFVGELRPWETGSVTPVAGTSPAALDLAVAHAAADLPQGAGLSVSLASTEQPWIVIDAPTAGGGARELRYYDPASGTPVSVPRESVALLLERLHTDLLLPSPWGRYLTGLLGVAMLVSLFTGVFMHRKLFREMWSIRLWRSVRLRWTELHKAVAVWGLPFHLMIAFTGAFLGLVGLILMVNAFVAFDGDVEAASAALSGESLPATGVAAHMRPATELLDAASVALPGLTPEHLVFSHYGDGAATLRVFGTLAETLIYYPSVLLGASSGAVLEVSNWREDHWARAIYGMMTPLHYASYGGLLLKTLYALLGVGASFLVISGLRIWQLRVHPRSNDLRLPLIAGVCYGLPLAIAGTMLVSRLLTWPLLAGYTGRLVAFLLLWTVALVFAFVRRHAGPGLALCRATGLLLVLIPVATGLGGRSWFEQWWLSTSMVPTVAVEVTLGLLGAAVLLAARYVRGARAPAAP